MIGKERTVAATTVKTLNCGTSLPPPSSLDQGHEAGQRRSAGPGKKRQTVCVAFIIHLFIKAEKEKKDRNVPYLNNPTHIPFPFRKTHHV